LGLEKDVDIVIKAVNILKKKYPDLVLDIIGDGPARVSLEKLVKKLQLEKNVKFLGFVPRSKVRLILKKYDFFVTASAIETQGLVILEAMAAGLPAIGVKKLATPEIIINDKSGYLAKPKNPKSLAEKMELFLHSKKKNKKIGAGAMEVALSHHIYGEVEKLENYYTEVVFKHLNKKNS
jgi:glycosyltransferase involved in cell wall biosynthesis